MVKPLWRAVPFRGPPSSRSRLVIVHWRPFATGRRQPAQSTSVRDARGHAPTTPDAVGGGFGLGLMWTSNHPPALRQTNRILSQLQHVIAQELHIRSMLLLVTPSLAHLLENTDFIHSALSQIYRQGDATRKHLVGTSHQLREWEIQTVAAVVDALPDIGEPRQGKLPAREGVAVLLSSSTPSPDASLPRSPNDETEWATLRFVSLSTPAHLGQMVTRQIIVPVANTLFVNGNRSTLLHDDWTVTTSSSNAVIRHLRRRPLKSFEVCTGCTAERLTQGSIPLKPLTPPRRVVRSMGNVLAQVDIDGEIAPASRELERAVSDLLGSRDHATRTSQQLQPPRVFAAVRSSTAGHGREDTGGTTARDSSTSMLATSRDVRLFRVTGGGGGWGKRQGLLSLDTAIDFERASSTTAFPDLDETPPVSGHDGPPGVALQGSTVEFLVYTGESEGDLDIPRPPREPVPTARSPTLFVLGTAVESTETPGTVEEESAGHVEAQLGRFGMISYNGCAIGRDVAVLRHEERQDPPTMSVDRFRTRVDVPDSYFVFEKPPWDPRG